MFSKILSKLKSIFSKKSITEIDKPKKQTKASKTVKTSKSAKKTTPKKKAATSKTTKTKKTTKLPKSKKQDKKIIIDSFSALPGVGSKSAIAFFY